MTMAIAGSLAGTLGLSGGMLSLVLFFDTSLSTGQIFAWAFVAGLLFAPELTGRLPGEADDPAAKSARGEAPDAIRAGLEQASERSLRGEAEHRGGIRA